MKKLKLLFTPIVFPFVPFSGYSTTSLAFALATAGATLIGFKFLPKFKKKVEYNVKLEKKLFFYGNPILFYAEVAETASIELKKIDWKQVGEKALMVVDAVDLAVGGVPVVGDVVDVIDTAAHIVYDYKYDKKHLYIDITFGVVALIPGMSSGASHVALNLVEFGVKARYGAKVAVAFSKYSKEFKWGLRTSLKVSKILKEVKIKDADEAVQIAYGLYLVSKRSKRYEEILEFSLKHSAKLKKYDGYIHRVLVQASIETKYFRETKLFKEVDELAKVYGKKTGNLLTLPLGNIKILKEMGKLDEALDILSDPAFRKFALVRIDADILTIDVERSMKFLRTLKKVTNEVEDAERKLRIVGEFQNDVELTSLEGVAGVYVKTGKLKFSYWAIYHGEKEMEDYMEYLVSHEMMHAIGVKTFSGYIYQLQYHYYSLRYGEDLAAVIVNEKFDLLNARLWKVVGNEKYIEQYLRAMEVDKLIRIEKGMLIAEKPSKVSAVYAAEYMALKGKRYPTNLGDYEKIIDELWKAYLRVLK